MGEGLFSREGLKDMADGLARAAMKKAVVGP
jgi:hypothetical protein